MTSDDLLDGIKRARLRLTTAEADVRDAEGLLRERKRALREARERYDAAIEEALAERRQPSLFDPPADPEPAPAPVAAPAFPHPAAEPTWRALTLFEAGFCDPPGTEPTPDAWADHIQIAVGGAGVRTCGDLAERLLAGETFGLLLTDVEDLYAAVEMLSADDERPIRFETGGEEDGPQIETGPAPSHEVGGPRPDPRRVPCVLCLAKAGDPCQTIKGTPRTDYCLRRVISAEQDQQAEAVAAAVSEAKAVAATKLADVDGFPDAVADALLPRGVSTVETLLEYLAAYDARVGLADLSLRNRLTTYLVADLGAKLKPAERAADAVARHVGPAAPGPDEPRKEPDTAPAPAKRKRKAVKG